MNPIEKAIIFAAKAHRNQTRKGTDIPYITHPFAVGMYMQKANCCEEVIAAGILHDTLEDTETTFDDLKESFGDRIWQRFNRGKREQHWYYASIVKALFTRKQQCHMIDELEREVIAVFGSLDFH